MQGIYTSQAIHNTHWLVHEDSGQGEPGENVYDARERVRAETSAEF